MLAMGSTIPPRLGDQGLEIEMSTTTLTTEQQRLAERQANDFALFAEYVDPDGAMATTNEEFAAIPFAERLAAAEFSVRESAE